jgi:hypothetical protein
VARTIVFRRLRLSRRLVSGYLLDASYVANLFHLPPISPQLVTAFGGDMRGRAVLPGRFFYGDRRRFFQPARCTDRFPLVKPVAVSRKVKSALSQLASTVSMARRAGSCTTRLRSARAVTRDFPCPAGAKVVAGRMLRGSATVRYRFRGCGRWGRERLRESPAQEQEVESAQRKQHGPGE